MNRHSASPGTSLRGLRSTGARGLCALLYTLLLSPARPNPDDARSLGELTIEQLMNESVTSVSKKEQRLGDAAAAISVLTNEDVRRSGATSVMEVLRLVPGLDVATVDSNQSAISARGFNGEFSNKLLVLLDGRAVYSPIFAGVFWDLQQTMLEDVDRIEVIRGPGATVWGANAVNGVINVVSRSARETQGGLLYGGGGNVLQAAGGARYGGRIGEDTYYRIFGSYQSNADFPMANGHSAGDSWQTRRGGFRIDSYPEADTHLTWQGDGSKSNLDDGNSQTYSFNTLGRLTRRLSDRSILEVQVYYDRTFLNDPTEAHVVGDTIDFTVQHTYGVGPRNDLIWGLGYRLSEEKIAATNPIVQVRNGNFGLHLFSAFLQDEFKIVPDRLTLSAGAKFEHNDYTGFELQPSMRAVFKPSPHQSVWAAVSRAVRTPAAVEGREMVGFLYGAPVAGPDGGQYVPTVVGNRKLTSEVLWAYEAGYRIQPAKNVSVDLAGFYNRYRDLIAIGGVARFVPGSPFGTAEIPLSNILRADTYGGEASLVVAPMDAWRLTAGYALLLTRFGGPAIANPAAQEETAPEHQIFLRSAYDITKWLSLDAQVRYIDPIRSVRSYIATDLRLSYRPTERLELSLVGQNIFTRQHPELGTISVTPPAESPRAVYGKFTWRY